MLALPAAEDLDIDVHVLGSSTKSSVFSVLDYRTNGVIVPNIAWTDKPDWKDRAGLERFAERVGQWNYITTEWENIPVETLEILAELWLIPRPNVVVIRQIQDRVTEKQLAERSGGTPVPFRGVNSLEELRESVTQLELPCILKTRKGGYDGKWQWKIGEETNLATLWEEISQFAQKEKLAEIPPLILEKMIDLDYEVSVILGIDHTGNIEALGPVYNMHENGILRYSIDPAPIADINKDRILAEARKLGARVSKDCGGYIGLLTIEFFVDKKWKIYVNEFAPRPHNSGHASLDSREVNQNHLWMLSASGNLVVPSTLKQPVLMSNILSQRELAEVFENANWIKWEGGIIYDYAKLPDKPDPKDDKQRKLGHINYIWDQIGDVIERVKTWEIFVPFID